MDTAKKAGYLLGLGIIGMVAFALFGAIHEARMGRPLSSDPPAPASREAAEVMARGAQHAFAEGARALQLGDRGAAMHAMDAGMRLAEVGVEAFGGSEPWRAASQHARDAKRAVASGHKQRAAEALQAAATSLRGAGAERAGPPPRAGYGGATLLNANGVRVGEVRSVDPGGGAELVIGGVHDLYGFLDWGGENLTVDADKLVYGPAQWPRPTLVVLPTLAQEPDAMIATFQR